MTGDGRGRRGLTVGAAPSCPLCCAEARAFQRIERLDYWSCPACEARFLDPCQRPSHDLERSYYLRHENDPDDPRYRRFLAKLADALLGRLSAPSCGLDYGCGPGPALAAMLREAGHTVALYDPLFAPDRAALEQQYDFVTCTETVEHFHRPAEEFARLMALVRPGGWLAIMTCFQTDDARFAGWHYRRDPTHVIFYRAETFRYVADRTGWSCEIPRKDVVLMRREAGPKKTSRRLGS